MAYLATHDYLEDKNFVDKWLYTMRTGEMDLSWMNAKTEKVTPRPQNARRGLTYRDLDLGTYGFTDVPKRSATIAPMLLGAPRFPRACPMRSRGSRAKASCGPSIPKAIMRKRCRANGTRPRHPMGPARRRRDARGDRLALSQLMTFLTG